MYVVVATLYKKSVSCVLNLEQIEKTITSSSMPLTARLPCPHPVLVRYPTLVPLR